MTDQTYNGWTNRETWLVHLWLTNTEYTYEAVRGLSSIQLESEVDQWLEDHIPQFKGFWLDLINAALGRVNWVEVAAAVNEA